VGFVGFLSLYAAFAEAMAAHVDPTNLEEFLPVVAVLLKNVAESLAETDEALAAAADVVPPVNRVTRVHAALVDMNTILAFVLHDFRLAHARTILDEELGFWVRPRSTAWFSQFLLHEYNDDRWVANFRFTKDAVFHMASVLAPNCERQNTKYRSAVAMRVRVACSLYKLVQGVSFLICSEMFAIGQSTVSIYLKDVVQAVNLEFGSEISFPRGNRLLNHKLSHEKCMTRSHQKFDLVPKLSLRVQLEGLSINKKYRVLISASQQRELYLNAFHPFCCVLDGLHCRIGDALIHVTTEESGFEGCAKNFFICWCTQGLEI
jgi:hypothetical protein